MGEESSLADYEVEKVLVIVPAFDRAQTTLPLCAFRLYEAQQTCSLPCYPLHLNRTGKFKDFPISQTQKHPMVLRRRQRKIKILSDNGSVQHTVEEQEKDSLESAIKQGNFRRLHRKVSASLSTFNIEEKVQKMLTDGFGDMQTLNDFSADIQGQVEREVDNWTIT